MYLIKLPNHLYVIYSVFYMLQLKLVPFSNITNHVNSSPPLLEIDSNLEFKIAQILDSKLNQQRREPLLYLVQLLGYKGTSKEYSWTLATDLENATRLVSEFHSLYPEKPGLLTNYYSLTSELYTCLKRGKE